MNVRADQRPRIAHVDGWPTEWEVVPADQGTGVFRIDHDGLWYHDGVRITQPLLVRAFAANVIKRDDGTYVLRWGPYDHPIAVADTPGVIRHVRGPEPNGDRFHTDLVDGRIALIDASRLWVGAKHVLYAELADTGAARFSRAAYYQMARWIAEIPGGFAVVVGGRSWPIGTGRPA